MSESAAPRAVLLDDGELDDVRALLGDLGVLFVDRQGSEAKPDLLVTTPRHAVEIGRSADSLTSRMHIVVVDGGTRTLLRMLERSECDFVLRRPVHPEVLRLLVLHALYRGPERRGSDRAAIGARIKIRSGLRSSTAVLTQLSRGGCGLLCNRNFDQGTTLKLVLPGEITRDSAFSIRGRVVELKKRKPDSPFGYELAVVFEAQDGIERQAIRRIIARGAVGDRLLSPNRDLEPAKAATKAPEEPKPTKFRRKSQRVSYSKRVLAGAEGATRVMIGRDLSIGGMKVGPDPDLCLGDEFRLALYGEVDQMPVTVMARVVRDDGDGGWVLHFIDIADEARDRVSRLMASLPVLADSDTGNPGPGVVVSERLDS